jgi:8-oxo-dGTP pyrophosphatase MutT (NUDIX family)
MIRAAGILFKTKDGLVLLTKRGNGSDHPGEWAVPGGQYETEDKDDVINTAIREGLEETGVKLKPESLKLHSRTITPPSITDTPALPNGAPIDQGATEPVDFTTYIMQCDIPFLPQLCEESTGFAWVDPAFPPIPMHPGAKIALDKLSWDESQIANAISQGLLTSPQFYENLSLFAMRITGTGLSYRSTLGEHVWRSPDIYLNEEFLARCQGLPVIMEHPTEKIMLTGGEFSDRIVGTVMFAYIKDDDVWGIVKIYDPISTKMIIDQKLSTSPAVVFRDPRVNSKVILEDGKPLLVEGKPSLLDHLAICQSGVWDKGQGPSGIDIQDTDTFRFSDILIIAALAETNANLLSAKISTHHNRRNFYG